MNVLETHREIFLFHLAIFPSLDSGGAVLVLDLETAHAEEDRQKDIKQKVELWSSSTKAYKFNIALEAIVGELENSHRSWKVERKVELVITSFARLVNQMHALGQRK